ncbi:hypothetical protein OOT08_11170, partial [Leucobacter sp. M11]|nr:hypothetical protein [Leucobacter sp. M11]
MTLSTEALIGLGLIVVFLVGSYLWYLWGLARLFPLLGLPETQGWIPVRNEMALLERGRVPGWIAILFLLPGIFVVPLVARGIAVHRIHREHRRGGGWTALAVAYPALWATIFWLELSDHPDLARMPAGTGRVGGLAQPTQPRETAPAEPARPGVFSDGFDEWGFTPVAGAAGEPGPVPVPAPAPAVSVAGAGPGTGPVPQPVALPSAAELPVAAAAPAPADAPAAAPGSRFAPALPDAGHPRAAADAREERDARDVPGVRPVSEVPDAR